MRKAKTKRTPKPRADSLQRRVGHQDKVSELSAKISNDISEDIDCGESRRTLRRAVKEWADEACEAHRRRADAETHLKMLAPALGLLEHSIGIVRVVLDQMPNAALCEVADKKRPN